MASSLMRAGTPMARARAGTSLFGPTSAPAATSAPSPTVAPFNTIDPDPMRALLPTVQPSRWAQCPMVTSSPMIVSSAPVQWITVPSCTEVRAPMTMRPESPRNTAPGQTDAPRPNVTPPITVASGWTYDSRTEEGKQYAISCRKQADDADTRHAPAEASAEHVLIDQNLEAGDSEFFAVGALSVSPDASLLAWSSDRAGAEVYELRFRDLSTGEDLPDVVPGTYYGSAWAADNRTYFYVKPDDAMRPYQLWRHTLGTTADEDVLVFEERDERFYLGVGTTKDDRFVILHLGSKVTDEIWYLDATDPTGAFRVVQPREQDVEYSLEHHGDRFLIVTNADGAEDF